MALRIVSAMCAENPKGVTVRLQKGLMIEGCTLFMLESNLLHMQRIKEAVN